MYICDNGDSKIIVVLMLLWVCINIIEYCRLKYFVVVSFLCMDFWVFCMFVDEKMFLIGGFVVDNDVSL